MSGPDSAGMRSELAAALRKAAHVCGWDVPCPCVDWPDEQYGATVHATAVSAGHVNEVQGIPEAFADALLHVVQRLAVEELERAAADYWRDVRFPIAREPEVRDWLRARADALAAAAQPADGETG